jgi:phosphoribosylformylglycinamidine synthase
VGRLIRLAVKAANEQSARASVDEMCRKLLANPVTEDYDIDLIGTGRGTGKGKGVEAE